MAEDKRIGEVGETECKMQYCCLRESLMKYGMIHGIVAAGLVLTFWMNSTGTAFAQFGGTRNSWFPRNNQPPLSAWLELERATTTELDAYNQFVKPQLEMERILTAQRREMNRRADDQKTMQKEISQMHNNLKNLQQNQSYQVQTEATPTGKGSGYSNYLHYYPQRRR